MPTRLSPERWRVVIPYLDAALELEPDRRVEWIDALRREDAVLADDVVALLDKHDVLDAQGYLDGGVGGTPRSTSLAGTVLGAYTLREPIGQGGMGTVWLADRTDGRYQGTAAVKLLNPSLLGEEGEGRFRREGSILARLRHPHIAQLIDAGVSPAGQPFLVLEHVDGQRIDRSCDEKALPVEARLRLFLDVLAAVAHAHRNLVVHRDLKPSNVMVDAEGRVKLLDFGIAKLVGLAPGESTNLTSTGARLMTPQYAAPEQLTGGDVTTATDVYALGALLYVLLTGRHPVGDDTCSPAELVRAIVDTEAARVSDAAATGAQAEGRAQQRATTPKRLRGALRGDLDNIVAKALKKDPAERYASAEAMAEDLRRHLDHLPVRARADSLGYRTRKFVTRHRLVLSAAAAVAIALATGAGVAVQQARASSRARDRALVDLRRAEAAADFTGFLLTEATPTQGRPVTNAELLARGEAVLDLRYADDPTTRVHLLLILAERYHENQQYDRWQATVERAFSVSRGVRDVGQRARASCVKAFSLVDEAPDDPATVALANRLLDEAFSDLDASPGSEADEAFCRVNESNISNKLPDAPRSVRAATRAVALEEQRGAPVTRRFEAGLALATAHFVSGAPHPADAEFERVMQLLDRQGLARSRDAAIVLNNWNRMWQLNGRPLKALPLSERALAIGRERAPGNGAVAVLVQNHANVLCNIGRWTEAVPLAEEALAKTRDEKSARRLVVALEVAASAYAGAGDLDRAAQALHEAERLLTDDPRASAAQLGALDKHRARLALWRGDQASAVAHAKQGLARPPAEQDVPVLELMLAEAHNDRRDFSDARAAVERAVPAV
ncbi:MAG: protein kinase, partial [Vicinamibacteria bacterium]